jgi:hypothetical protein
VVQNGGGVTGASVKLIIFHCGHAYHQSCLIDHDRTSTLSPSRGTPSSMTTTPWRCVLCCRSVKRSALKDTKSSVKPLSKQQQRQQSDVILSQLSAVTSPLRDLIDPVQNASVRRLHTAQKTSSRLAVLAELNELEKTRSRTPTTPAFNSNTSAASSGLLTHDAMMLRLAPPPAVLD